jgi:hypothetical protein
MPSSLNPPLQCECIVSIGLVDKNEISKLALVNDHINVTNSPLKHSISTNYYNTKNILNFIMIYLHVPYGSLNK